LAQAKSIWIASAMISDSGWSFIQKQLSKDVIQHYLIGIDLSTHPSVFQSILNNLEINARVFENAFTFHPKVYIIQKNDDSLTAFIGSSNTTTWGLEKNVEMNFQINDQVECNKLKNWFNRLFAEGYLVTPEFLDDYKSKFVKASYLTKEVESEAAQLKKELSNDKGQFFSRNQHIIFNKKYHRESSEDLKMIRKEVRNKFLVLHKSIYPQFSTYGLADLHCHHQSREIVSRHFFNKFSGNYINAMWLHYGKSLTQLKVYKNADTSTNRADSFINNIRMQVIIREDSIGIWVVLGRNNASKKDREHFRKQMQDVTNQKIFFDALKNLGNEYWLDFPEASAINDIKTPDDLIEEIQKETLDEYFIIGCNINWLDSRLSSQNISTTVLNEFNKLYPLYLMMRHK
jgi:HKD family nuclease